eukprot:192401_1
MSSIESSKYSKHDKIEELVSFMDRYASFTNGSSTSFIYNNIDNNENVLHILDLFLNQSHKTHTHNNEESIRKQPKCCDVKKCMIFRRNYRNKSKMVDKLKLYTLYQTKNIPCWQIFDKIHCYHQHSVDIGNELSQNEQLYVNNESHIEQKQNLNQCEFTKIKKILADKRAVLTNIPGVKLRKSHKFNQLSPHQIRNGHTVQMYAFGKEFIYDNEEPSTDSGYIQVRQKYYTLKEELIQNKLQHISIEQFNNEFSKATIHYKSNFRKQNKQYNDIQINHILSLMIYCNYDALQYIFSKTYREKESEHNNF